MHKERLRCRRGWHVPSGLGGRRAADLGGDISLLQIDNDLADHVEGLWEGELLGISEVWVTTELEKEALRRVSLAAATAFNATMARASPPPVAAPVAAQTGKLSAQAAGALAAGPGGAFGGPLVWALLVVVALLAMSCCLCFMRGLDRKSTGPPPHAMDEKTGGRSRPVPGPGASAGIGVPQGQAKRAPGSATSLASARSGFSTVSRTTRDSRAGRLLSARLHGRGGAASLTPSSKAPVSKHYTFGEERQPGGSSARDFRFTVPVDTLVEAAEQGSFDIRDIGSGLLLKVAMRRDDEGQRVLEVFQGLGARTPCTTVGPPKPGSSSDPDSLDLRGPHGLGNLTLQGNGSFLMSAQGQPLFVIEGNEADLDLRISARDGRLVGAVSCNDANFSGEEHVEFRVLAGTDPVMVVSCILAVLFLCGDDEEAAAASGS